MCTQITWASCYNTDSDPAILGYSLRFRITNRLPGDADAACPHTTHWRPLPILSIVTSLSRAFLASYPLGPLHLSERLYPHHSCSPDQFYASITLPQIYSRSKGRPTYSDFFSIDLLSSIDLFSSSDPFSSELSCSRVNQLAFGNLCMWRNGLDYRQISTLGVVGPPNTICSRVDRSLFFSPHRSFYSEVL